MIIGIQAPIEAERAGLDAAGCSGKGPDAARPNRPRRRLSFR